MNFSQAIAERVENTIAELEALIDGNFYIAKHEEKLSAAIDELIEQESVSKEGIINLKELQDEGANLKNKNFLLQKKLYKSVLNVVSSIEIELRKISQPSVEA